MNAELSSRIDALIHEMIVIREELGEPTQDHPQIAEGRFRLELAVRSLASFSQDLKRQPWQPVIDIRQLDTIC